MAAPTVFLTGATGFLGGATLAHLLAARPDARVLVLARDRGPDPAADRVRRSLERFVGPERAADGLRRCEVIAGDVTDSAVLGGPVLDTATHVVHLAANTNFRSVRRVRHTNVYGTLALAHRMRRVRTLERFLYIGTAYVCGEAAGPVVDEDEFPHPRARHFTEYTASKAECELMLEATAPDLPWVAARPSVVVGHTRLGCEPSASLYWFFRACHLLRQLTCPLDSRDDVVPVDWVADALLFKSDLRHRRYHLSAGEGSCVTWREIAAVLASSYGERPGEPYQITDGPDFRLDRTRVRDRLGPDGADHLMTALPLYYRFMAIGAEVFTNTRLLAEGMPPPPPFASYLGLCASRPADRSVYQQMLDDV